MPAHVRRDYSHLPVEEQFVVTKLHVETWHPHSAAW
jgi:hypothetical protein